MFKRFFSLRARLYLGIAAWLLLAYLIVSLRYVSQVGKAVQMDIQATALTEEILRPTDTPAEQARFTQLGSNPRGRETPFYFFVLVSLSGQEIEHPIQPEHTNLPSVIHFYEIRTIAGVDLPGYAVSVVWRQAPLNTCWVPVPYFRLFSISVKTALRRISLTAMSRQKDVFAANVGFFHPAFAQSVGWSPTSARILHRIDVSVPRTQKVYRWGAFSPPPVYGYICFCRAGGVRSFALYRNREEAQKAVLRLWDTNGYTQVVRQGRHSP